MNTRQARNQKIIEDHKLFLAQLKEKFIQDCDRITEQAKKKLALTPEEDLKIRQRIFTDQQLALSGVLAQLTGEINRADQKLLKSLEEVDVEAESEKLTQMDQLINNL